MRKLLIDDSNTGSARETHNSSRNKSENAFFGTNPKKGQELAS
jgi:hypothetical protein